MARVGDEVAFGCENLGVPSEEIWPRVRDALAAVGLDVPLDHPTSRLSGGQKQRLALACALAMRPGLLLLDEPTANLDPNGVAEVRAAVEALPPTTVVVVDHRTEVWSDFVDRTIALPVNAAPTRSEPLARAARLDAPARPRQRAVRAGGLVVGREGVAVQPPIDLEVREGEALAIVGPNGSGKSTLALTLAGLLPKLGGDLDVLGHGDPARWRSRDLLARVGMVFQSPEHQFLARTVREELAIGPRALGLPPERVRERVDELLERLGLDAVDRAHPFSLSGGQQRRLSVGTALAVGPALLVLDEPTFGQDERTWRELVALLAEARDVGSALVLVTHDERLPDALAARRLELRRSERANGGVAE